MMVLLFGSPLAFAQNITSSSNCSVARKVTKGFNPVLFSNVSQTVLGINDRSARKLEFWDLDAGTKILSLGARNSESHHLTLKGHSLYGVIAAWVKTTGKQDSIVIRTSGFNKVFGDQDDVSAFIQNLQRKNGQYVSHLSIQRKGVWFTLNWQQVRKDSDRVYSCSFNIETAKGSCLDQPAREFDPSIGLFSDARVFSFVEQVKDKQILYKDFFTLSGFAGSKIAYNNAAQSVGPELYINESGKDQTVIDADAGNLLYREWNREDNSIAYRVVSTTDASDSNKIMEVPSNQMIFMNGLVHDPGTNNSEWLSYEMPKSENSEAALYVRNVSGGSGKKLLSSPHLTGSHAVSHDGKVVFALDDGSIHYISDCRF